MFNLRNRAAAVLMVLVAVFAFAPSIMAQDDMPTSPTFGLGEEEFASFATANANSFEAGEYGYSFSTALTIDADGEPLSAELNGSGVIGMEGFSLAVVGDLAGMPVDVEARIVGESLYVTGIDGTETWYQVSEGDLEELQGAIEDQIPFDAEALASGDAEALGLSEEAQMEAFGAVFSLLEEVPALISIESGEANGLTSYQINLPLAEIAELESVQTVVAVGLTSNDPEMEFEQAQMEAAGAVGMASQVLSGSELTYTQLVDEATSLVQQGILNFSLGDSAPIVLDLTLDVMLDYDADVALAAPADVVPASELLGGM